MKLIQNKTTCVVHVLHVQHNHSFDRYETACGHVLKHVVTNPIYPDRWHKPTCATCLGVFMSNKKGTEKNLAKKAAKKLSSEQIKTVNQAIAEAAKITQSKDRSLALDLICSTFLSTQVGMDVCRFLKEVERQVRMRLIAYDEECNEIVFGGDLIDDLSQRARGNHEADIH